MTDLRSPAPPAQHDPVRAHDLLLGLAGAIDDDLLATARELVAVGEEPQAVELLVASLVADRTALPDEVRAAVVAVARSRHVEFDAQRWLAPAGRPPVHRFGPEPARGAEHLVELLRADRGPVGSTLRLAWRLTPAGSAPGPLPHPVVLVELGGPQVHAEIVAYRLGAHLARNGVRASVEVYLAGAPLPGYQVEALRHAATIVEPGAESPHASRAVPPPPARPGVDGPVPAPGPSAGPVASLPEAAPASAPGGTPGALVAGPGGPAAAGSTPADPVPPDGPPIAGPGTVPPGALPAAGPGTVPPGLLRPAGPGTPAPGGVALPGTGTVPPGALRPAAPGALPPAAGISFGPGTVPPGVLRLAGPGTVPPGALVGPGVPGAGTLPPGTDPAAGSDRRHAGPEPGDRSRPWRAVPAPLPPAEDLPGGPVESREEPAGADEPAGQSPEGEETRTVPFMRPHRRDRPGAPPLSLVPDPDEWSGPDGTGRNEGSFESRPAPRPRPAPVTEPTPVVPPHGDVERPDPGTVTPLPRPGRRTADPLDGSLSADAAEPEDRTDPPVLASMHDPLSGPLQAPLLDALLEPERRPPEEHADPRGEDRLGPRRGDRRREGLRRSAHRDDNAAGDGLEEDRHSDENVPAGPAPRDGERGPDEPGEGRLGLPETEGAEPVAPAPAAEEPHTGRSPGEQGPAWERAERPGPRLPRAEWTADWASGAWAMPQPPAGARNGHRRAGRAAEEPVTGEPGSGNRAEPSAGARAADTGGDAVASPRPAEAGDAAVPGADPSAEQEPSEPAAPGAAETPNASGGPIGEPGPRERPGEPFGGAPTSLMTQDEAEPPEARGEPFGTLPRDERADAGPAAREARRPGEDSSDAGAADRDLPPAPRPTGDEPGSGPAAEPVDAEESEPEPYGRRAARDGAPTFRPPGSGLPGGRRRARHRSAEQEEEEPGSVPAPRPVRRTGPVLHPFGVEPGGSPGGAALFGEPDPSAPRGRRSFRRPPAGPGSGDPGRPAAPFASGRATGPMPPRPTPAASGGPAASEDAPDDPGAFDASSDSSGDAREAFPAPPAIDGAGARTRADVGFPPAEEDREPDAALPDDGVPRLRGREQDILRRFREELSARGLDGPLVREPEDSPARDQDGPPGPRPTNGHRRPG